MWDHPCLRNGKASRSERVSKAPPLTGQVAWVTGAARGIGAATARRLALLGATVHLSDVLPCDLAVEAVRVEGASARSHRLDITDREACARLVAEILADDGRLDMVVCNAGVCPPGSVAGDWDQWEKVLAVNLDGTQHCVAAAWAALTEAGSRPAGGRLVLVSSMAYYQGGLIVGTEYSAAKAALIGMTRHLARNGGPLGIRCNAVAPGIIETDMTAGFDKPDRERIPLRRLGSAEDVAGPIAFLCGPDSDYMTGTVLNVTGGMILAA
jgi:3-oxoacyl-[acyl-carrier protein] reductase